MKLFLLFCTLSKQRERPKIEAIEDDTKNATAILNSSLTKNSSKISIIKENTTQETIETIGNVSAKSVNDVNMSKIAIKGENSTKHSNNLTTTLNATSVVREKLVESKNNESLLENKNKLNNENRIKSQKNETESEEMQNQKYIVLVDLSTPVPTKSEYERLKELGLLPSYFSSPAPTPAPSQVITIEPTISATLDQSPLPTQSEVLLMGVVRGKGKRKKLPPPTQTLYPTKTPTPPPTPTASAEPKEEEEDPDEMLEEKMQRNVPERERKIAVIGVQRLRPTQSKTPDVSWDDFLSKTSTSIYLGLVGFVIGAIYAWYAFILSPSSEPTHIPAIFKSQGVDLEEVTEKPMPKPRAY